MVRRCPCNWPELLVDVKFGPFLLEGTSFILQEASNESINDWGARLRSLATQCEFGQELDVCLRDRFIMGFPTGPVLDRLLEENVTITLADAMKIASNKMTAQDHYGIFETRSCASVKEKRRHVLQGSRGKSARSTRDGKCQICGKENHSTNSLPFSIFSPKKGIPEYSANYDYEIQFVKSEANYADSLSRIPLSTTHDNSQEIFGRKLYKIDCDCKWWWLKLDKQIEELCKNCTNCNRYNYNLPKAELNPWPFPSQPWERIHIDYLGPLLGGFFRREQVNQRGTLTLRVNHARGKTTLEESRGNSTC
ncbi:hypothetical protein Trydic_g1346 [Trypoxylus dichotomus]